MSEKQNWKISMWYKMKNKLLGVSWQQVSQNEHTCKT